MFDKKIAIVGVGYVGIRLVEAFSNLELDVIAYDIDEKKIECFKIGLDPTNEIGINNLYTSVQFTTRASKLQDADYVIVTVPTPVNDDNLPNLEPLFESTKVVAQNIKKGQSVIYESTVYPGVTRNKLVPILENISKLKAGIDFFVGYSPERLMPGNANFSLIIITKIVSGLNKKSLEIISNLYALITPVKEVSSMEVAEAAKVIENTQKDVNIAFMNETSKILDSMGINTYEVLDAMNTRPDALKITPGLVGGHCIGVDTYYMIYAASELKSPSLIMRTARSINNEMPYYIVRKLEKKLAELPLDFSRRKRVAIFGITFKENVSDIRNSLAAKMVNMLKNQVEIVAVDPRADFLETYNFYRFELTQLNQVEDLDALILAVPHEEFLDVDIENLFRDKNNIIFLDLKGLYRNTKLAKMGGYWTL